jgi:hypothetical protein
MIPCRCQCGKEREINHYNLLYGKSVSCRCYSIELVQERCVIHGASRTFLYGVWLGIRKRCTNRSEPQYRDYGGRGIRVCEEWMHDFVAFRDWANANGYTRGLDIDRIDNDGNYDPSNCRFVTRQRNNRNKRTTRWLTAFGETKSLMDWAEDGRCVVSYSQLRDRLNDAWPHEDALVTPSGHRAA